MTATDKAADRWGVSTPSGYNPNAYYTQASDKKGHSAKMGVKIPVTIAGEVGVVVSSDKIPEYRTVQDFIRDAIIHRLHDIQQILDDPDLERKLTMYTIHDEAMRSKQARDQYADMMESLQDQFTHLSTTGQTARLRTYLTDLIDKAEIAIPEEFRLDYIRDLSARLRVIGG